MNFELRVKNDDKVYLMNVTQIHSDSEFEFFKIEPHTGTGKNITIRSNRPLLRNKGLKHRRPYWRIIEGVVNNRSAFESFTKALEKKLKEF